MSAACREADRLAQCRAVFERAQADRVDMDEAKRRLRADRWREADARLAAKRCGTVATASAQPEQYWQRW